MQKPSDESLFTVTDECLARISIYISIRELERILVLSQGYLSKVMNRAQVPSVPLVILLYQINLAPLHMITLSAELRGYRVRFKKHRKKIRIPIFRKPGMLSAT